MTHDDIGDGLRLCRAARWNQRADDWARFLDSQPDGALVACREGRVVGSVATIRYAPDLAWVAMVLVAPEERGRGIGRALLEHGLALVADVPCVGLDATPAGRPLYLSLGFVDAFTLTRMQRAASAGASQGTGSGGGRTGSAPATRVRPVAEDDWGAVLADDLAHVGADRAAMLRWLAAGAREYAWVAEGEGGRGPRGVLLGRHGHDFEHLGPLTAAGLAEAQALVDAALPQVDQGRPVVVDAVDDQPGWRAWLATRGFEAQRPFTRMYLGRPRTRPDRVFAIIGPEFG